MSLDKSLEKAKSAKETALYRPLAQNISAALKDHGFLKIAAFPSIDSVIAASITASFVYSNGWDAEILIGAKPPREIKEPTVLIGYPALVLDEISIHAITVLISGEGAREGLAVVPTLYQPDSSLAASMASVLSEIGVVGELGLYAIVSGYWRGLDTGRRADFKGAEKTIIDSLKLEGKLVEGFTLRLFGWYDRPLEESLVTTIEPFIPGITGREEGARALLDEDPRLKGLGITPVGSIREEKLAIIGEKLYNIIKEKSRVQRRPSEIIGLTYYAPQSPVRDPRETAIVYAALSEVEGLEVLAAAAIAPLHVTSTAYYHYYERVFEKVVEDVYRLLGGAKPRRISVMGVRLAIAETEAPITLVDRILRQLGLIGADEVLAVEVENGLRVPLERTMMLLGFKKLYNAISEGCIELTNKTVALVKPSHCSS